MNPPNHVHLLLELHPSHRHLFQPLQNHHRRRVHQGRLICHPIYPLPEHLSGVCEYVLQVETISVSLEEQRCFSLYEISTLVAIDFHFVDEIDSFLPDFTASLGSLLERKIIMDTTIITNPMTHATIVILRIAWPNIFPPCENIINLFKNVEHRGLGIDCRHKTHYFRQTMPLGTVESIFGQVR